MRRAGLRNLGREIRILLRAAVVFMQLRQRKRVDRNTGLRAGAYGGVDERIVRNHCHVVLRDGEIGLDEVGFLPYGECVGREGMLGRVR